MALTKKQNKNRKNKTQRNNNRKENKPKNLGIIILPNNTPKDVAEISQNINDDLEKSSSRVPVKSYSPTINKDLSST